MLGIVALGCVWWCLPKNFLTNVNAEDVAVIHVRNGNTGESYSIETSEDIAYIVTEIQNQYFRKSGISLFRMGTWLTLSFCDAEVKEISEFIINGSATSRKDPFFIRQIVRF